MWGVLSYRVIEKPDTSLIKCKGSPFMKMLNTKNIKADCLTLVSPQKSSLSSPPKISPQAYYCLLCQFGLIFHPNLA